MGRAAASQPGSPAQLLQLLSKPQARKASSLPRSLLLRLLHSSISLHNVTLNKIPVPCTFSRGKQNHAKIADESG